ncbi:glycosyl transferase [Vibrio inusitatus NBRC 102082]|uniref:Glycosyl transferase n=1 Tax=Vibrio inusitatus NBRC 102082 TaxID=1219070 RepID=A0A4Y3HTN3_9VIBR|nr:glycosyltransferase [Vibrio inusitatus]GEA50331.1 glycosyl transferase [Vibrio inusitatus NBRC 102082]
MHPTTNLLIVHYGDDWIRGSEACLLNLIDSLSPSFRPVVWTNNQVLVRELTAKGVATHSSNFEVINFQQTAFNIKALFELYNTASTLISEHNINLIHVNSGAPCQWMTFVAKAKRIPMLCQLHSPYNLHDRFTLGLHSAQHLVAVSHAVATPILDEGYPDQNLTVVHNGVPNIDLSQPINVRERFDIPPHAKVLISVGSLIKRKGFDKLIQALALLNSNQDPHHLIIIGDGSERLNLIKQIESLDLDSKVHLVGEQSNVNAWLAGGCDLFVSGARSEAFGLVLVEASLAGLAVIAPNVGGISEVIEHNSTGLLYENGDNEILFIVDAVSQLIQNPTSRQAMASRGKLVAQHRFSLEQNTSQIESIYNQLIDSGIKQSWLSWLSSLLRPFGTFFRTRFLSESKTVRNAHEA